MKTLAIIPARYASTRFSGKPLALLGGKPVVQWVWERVAMCAEVDDMVVATDDERIATAVQAFGGRALMTGSHHRCGTERCGEVLELLAAQGDEYDAVINVQGDEPFVQPSQLHTLVECLSAEKADIATLRTPIESLAELQSANNVKVVCDLQGRALYFSRQPIPYLRGVESDQWVVRHRYYKHVGLYAFWSDTLRRLVGLPQSDLELAESLEQLRWLQHGYTIQVGDTQSANIGIDTPDDLRVAEAMINTANITTT